MIVDNLMKAVISSLKSNTKWYQMLDILDQHLPKNKHKLWKLNYMWYCAFNWKLNCRSFISIKLLVVMMSKDFYYDLFMIMRFDEKASFLIVQLIQVLFFLLLEQNIFDCNKINILFLTIFVSFVLLLINDCEIGHVSHIFIK